MAQLLSFWMMQGMSWLHCLMARATLTAHLAFLRNLHLDLDAHISSSSSVSASSSAMRSSTWECTSGRHCEAQAVMFLNAWLQLLCVCVCVFCSYVRVCGVGRDWRTGELETYALWAHCWVQAESSQATEHSREAAQVASLMQASSS